MATSSPPSPSVPTSSLPLHGGAGAPGPPPRPPSIPPHPSSVSSLTYPAGASVSPAELILGTVAPPAASPASPGPPLHGGAVGAGAPGPTPLPLSSHLLPPLIPSEIPVVGASESSAVPVSSAAAPPAALVAAPPPFPIHLTAVEAAGHPIAHPLTLPPASPPTLAALAAFHLAVALPPAVAAELVLPLAECRLSLSSTSCSPTTDLFGSDNAGASLVGLSDLAEYPRLHEFTATWPTPDLPRCDRCGLDCSALLLLRPPEHAECPRCSWFPLSDFYSEADAYDHGDGGRCVACGHAQTPLAPQCVGCGGLVLGADTDHYLFFGRFHSRELLVAMGRSLALPWRAFAAVLRGGGLQCADAEIVARAYAMQVGVGRYFPPSALVVAAAHTFAAAATAAVGGARLAPASLPLGHAADRAAPDAVSVTGVAVGAI